MPPGVTRDLREVIEAWDELPGHALDAVVLLVRIFLFSIESMEDRKIQEEGP